MTVRLVVEAAEPAAVAAEVWVGNKAVLPFRSCWSNPV
jgi:hypothetical protein